MTQEEYIKNLEGSLEEYKKLAKSWETMYNDLKFILENTHTEFKKINKKL